jgi:hypothetical protein
MTRGVPATTPAIALAGLTGLGVLPGRAAAHGDGGGTHTVLGPGLFVLGVGLVGGAVAADARDAVTPRQADAGVYAGIALVVAGLAVYYVV